MSSDHFEPIAGTAWLTDDAPSLEGDVVHVSADLTDVDEVMVKVVEGRGADAEGTEVVVLHLPRVQAIALAGWIAHAATTDWSGLPSGHGAGGPLDNA